MTIKIFITKKTHLTSAPVGKKTAFVKFETNLEIGQFLQLNRKKIIFLKDTLLNRENLSVAELEAKVSLIKTSIEGQTDLPKDFIEPIGIKTPEQIIAKKAIAEKEKPKAEVKAEDKKPKGSKSKKVETQTV